MCARQPITPTTLWGLNSPALQTLFSDCPSHQKTAGANCPGCPFLLRQYRIIPALRLKHRSGSCGTASALPKCSIMSGCGTRIVLRGQKPLALCDRCPCFGSLFPPLAALTFAASSIICAFGLAAAAPRSLYRHLELCGIALTSTFTAQCGNLHCGLPRQKHGKALPHRCPSCQCRQRRALRPAPSHWCGRSRAAP